MFKQLLELWLVSAAFRGSSADEGDSNLRPRRLPGLLDLQASRSKVTAKAGLLSPCVARSGASAEPAGRAAFQPLLGVVLENR